MHCSFGTRDPKSLCGSSYEIIAAVSAQIVFPDFAGKNRTIGQVMLSTDFKLKDKSESGASGARPRKLQPEAMAPERQP
jgi:hypothetical protein